MCSVNPIYWTDGKSQDEWGVLDSITTKLVQCPHCQTCLWIDEQERVGSVEYGSSEEVLKSNKAYNSSESYCIPNLCDYLQELAESNIDSTKEKYLRLRAWWAGNDKRRYVHVEQRDLSAAEEENLKIFYKTLDPCRDEDRIMMAEIKRELSEFDDVEAIIMKPFSDISFQATVMIIKELTDKGDSVVAAMRYKSDQMDSGD